MKKSTKNCLFRLLLGAWIYALAIPAVALTATEVTKLLSSDGARGDRIAWSVSVSGDTALIGSWADVNENGVNAGAAYVFVRGSDGTWSQQAKLLADDGDDFDFFGVSVGISGETAVIGAPGDAVTIGDPLGSAYVFTRSGSTWTQQSKLTASDAARGDEFGRTVSISGNTVLIGAQGSTGNSFDSGAAFVFIRAGDGTWTQQAKLAASDGARNDLFGGSVSISGDTAVIGAFFDGDNGFLSGSAYVFVRSGSSWAQQAKLLAGDGASFDRFSEFEAVSVSGDTVVIGAQFHSHNGLVRSGSAYVFVRSGSTWTQQAELISNDLADSDLFGISVSLYGDTAIVGASSDDDNGSLSGSAYVFTRSGSTWTQQAKMLASDGAFFDLFGWSVSLSGATVVVGAPQNDDKGTNSGSAYIFLLSGDDDEAPIVSNVLATPNPVAVNTAVDLSAAVDDSSTGDSDIASATYSIDGGTAVAMSGSFDASTVTVSATLSFAQSGVYTICVSGTDVAGNTGAEACTLLAVYDPDAGFVTGGGWINSPAGACDLSATCQGATGKAHFGFVSRYHKGANIPTGNTAFKLDAGDLKFKSEAYEWLVIAGQKAQYKGVGTINGGGDYGFMLFAVDAALSANTDTDRFRIKIWDRADADRVVYDNEAGVADNDVAATAIAGGSIVIHSQ